ncbi:hypothetical protein BGX38DRAFT_1333015 [Terfezia claveryi]|nr:hypothetical protein BGX38DRAFT_1333015 [Terfezia claveryi]
MESSTAAIMEKALKWLTMDKNPVTHAEIQRLLDAHNFDELNKKLDERIVFGTAGMALLLTFMTLLLTLTRPTCANASRLVSNRSLGAL